MDFFSVVTSPGVLHLLPLEIQYQNASPLSTQCHFLSCCAQGILPVLQVSPERLFYFVNKTGQTIHGFYKCRRLSVENASEICNNIHYH